MEAKDINKMMAISQIHMCIFNLYDVLEAVSDYVPEIRENIEIILKESDKALDIMEDMNKKIWEKENGKK